MGNVVHVEISMSESAELEPWQQRVLEKFKGRGMVQITGRNTGKSHWTNVAIKRLMDDLNSNPVQDLVLSEGKVYGQTYHCVEPVGGNWLEMEIWALDTYGSPGSVWKEPNPRTPEPDSRYYMNDRKFWFRNKKDRDWFILKWRS
jgi:hypothetical protein